MKAIYTLLLMLIGGKVLFSQGAKIVFNGAYLKIIDDAYLVIDNPDTTAISRTSSGGYIISEGENNNVQWNIGDGTGHFTVPFGYSTTDYLPLSFRTSLAGTNDGVVIMSTYGTPNWQNSLYLPTGVAHVGGMGGIDNSKYVADRFWKVSFSGYTDKPELASLLLSYRDIEEAAPNTMLESDVALQRYNPILEDWIDFLPDYSTTVIDIFDNTVEAKSIIPSSELYDWWTIADRIRPLPIELVKFDVSLMNNDLVALDWQTASEINTDYYIVQRSTDGTHWEDINTTPAEGNSNIPSFYHVTDQNPPSGIIYYRLKEIDIGGRFTFSKIEEIEILQSKIQTAFLYPNPSTTVTHIKIPYSKQLEALFIYDAQGKQVKHIQHPTHSNLIDIQVNSLPQGSYWIKLQYHDNKGETLPFIIQ